mmetsp:Transcript_49683/g.131701  ORF Transcript_49683/g.131701 Transcript_49683/m.131701 type:complete len:109 (+) Transcript_49683:970-1296(+)
MDATDQSRHFLKNFTRLEGKQKTPRGVLHLERGFLDVYNLDASHAMCKLHWFETLTSVWSADRMPDLLASKRRSGDSSGPNQCFERFLETKIVWDFFPGTKVVHHFLG